MFHFAIFGGNEGQLANGRTVHVTVFGSSSLTRMPTARHLAELGRQLETTGSGPHHFFLTLFGGAEVIWPSLADEYLALHEAVRTGVLSLDQWDRLLARPGSAGVLRVASLTLFGGFDADVVPSEDKELDDLAVQRHLAQIPPKAMDLLMLAIGQKGVQRLAAVRQAVSAAFAS